MFTVSIFLGVNPFSPDGQALVKAGSNYALLTLDGEPWRILTGIFLHSGFLHLFFNLYALFFLGFALERAVGSLRFLIVYLGSGFCGAVLGLFLNPLGNSVGASGAIFGLFGLFFMIVLVRLRGSDPQTRREKLFQAGFILLLNLVMSFLPGIDMWAHFGGLLAGLLAGLLIAALPLRTGKGYSYHMVNVLLLTVFTVITVFGLLQAPSFNKVLKQNRVNETRALKAYNASRRIIMENTDRSILSNTAEDLEKETLPLWAENSRTLSTFDMNGRIPYIKRLKRYSEIMYGLTLDLVNRLYDGRKEPDAGETLLIEELNRLYEAGTDQ